MLMNTCGSKNAKDAALFSKTLYIKRADFYIIKNGMRRRSARPSAFKVFLQNVTAIKNIEEYSSGHTRAVLKTV